VNLSYSEFCVCPVCQSDLTESPSALRCERCSKTYKTLNGIPRLLPNYDATQERYRQNYEKVASNFLANNKYQADNVSYRHEALLNFIGREHIGRRILDVGSSHALYLADIQADVKVAIDIAETYLKVIPTSVNVIPILADAEQLPFKRGFFDLIIVADVLEHLLNPEMFVQAVVALATEDTRIIVHIPWEENLEPYLHCGYEFAHLRSFNTFNFSQIWNQFHICRSKYTFPDLRYPLLFGLERLLPRSIYNVLVRRYFFTPGVAARDAAWRQRRLESLPKWEWVLLRLFKPVFRMFEMRLRTLV